MFKLDKFKFDLARARKCYNKKQVAEEANISYDNLMKILSGKIKLTAKMLGKISKALDVEPQDLIETNQTATDEHLANVKANA